MDLWERWRRNPWKVESGSRTRQQRQGSRDRRGGHHALGKGNNRAVISGWPTTQGHWSSNSPWEVLKPSTPHGNDLQHQSTFRKAMSRNFFSQKVASVEFVATKGGGGYIIGSF